MIKFEKVNNLKIPCITTALEKIIKLVVDTITTSIILERIKNKEQECQSLKYQIEMKEYKR